MINDDLDKVTNAIVDLFDTSLSDVILALENQPSQQEPINSVWCRFVNRPNTKGQTTLGITPVFEQLGLSTLQIFVPLGMGEALGYDVAETVDATMRKWTSSDKRMRVYSTEYRSIPATQKSPYFQINYTMYWRSKQS